MNTATNNTNIPFVMASAFRPEYTFEENMERLEGFKGEHELSLKITVGGIYDACRISKIAAVIYDQDAVLYVDSHNKGYTATKDGFYSVI